jgi:NADPH2 dehydrogenase
MIDQFTQDNCNQRTDRWGGSIENRARFGLEVARAVVAAIGASRVGIRLSPWSTFQAMRMEDPVPQFTYLINGLRQLKLAYLHLVTSRIQGGLEVPDAEDTLDFAVVLAGGYSSASAREVVEVTYRDFDVLVAFGRFFISTPDLPFRVQHGIELSPYDRHTFYKAKSTDGYTDYPFSQEWTAAQSKL